MEVASPVVPAGLEEVQEEPLVPASKEVAEFASAETRAPRLVPRWVWRSQKNRVEGSIDWENLEW
jgi:hypothetical protein